MSPWDAIALVIMGCGILLTMIAAVGLHRFGDALTRTHAASKPQTLGLLLVLAGTALLGRSWAGAGLLLLVLLAQMATVPVASTMVGRAAFRRGFIRGGEYAVDELSPRLAHADDIDDDEDGFLDEYLGDEGDSAETVEDRFPENRVPVPDGRSPSADLTTASMWEEPEAGEAESGDGGLDVDLGDETEREAGDLAGRDR